MDADELTMRLRAIAKRRGACPGTRLKEEAITEPVGFSGANNGARLTEDEVEFGKAMEQYKRDHHRPYPTFAEAFQVLMSLGYQKPAGHLPIDIRLGE